MSILDYIFSKLPDNSSKKITAKDVRDSFQKMDERIDDAKSGIKGNATQANAPTPYDAVTYPSGLFETYQVRTPLTMPNSWGSAVTQAELDANYVFFDVRNGVISKEVSLKPTADLSATLNPLGTTKAPQEKAVADYVKPIFDLTEKVYSGNIFNKLTDDIQVGSLTATGTLEPNGSAFRVRMPESILNVGKTYTMKNGTVSIVDKAKVSFFNSDGSVISFINTTLANRGLVTFTVPVGTVNTYVQIGNAVNTNLMPLRDNALVNTVMINEGTTAKPYADYVAPTLIVKDIKIEIDQVLNPTSLNPQSGKAVADYIEIGKKYSGNILPKNVFNDVKKVLDKNGDYHAFLYETTGTGLIEFDTILGKNVYSHYKTAPNNFSAYLNFRFRNKLRDGFVSGDNVRIKGKIYIDVGDSGTTSPKVEYKLMKSALYPEGVDVQDSVRRVDTPNKVWTDFEYTVPLTDTTDAEFMSFRALIYLIAPIVTKSSKISIADLSIEFFKAGVTLPTEITQQKTIAYQKQEFQSLDADYLNSEEAILEKIFFRKLQTYQGGSDIFLNKLRTLLMQTEMISFKDSIRRPSQTGHHLVVIDNELFYFENGVKYKLNKTLA